MCGIDSPLSREEPASAEIVAAWREI